MIRNRKCLCLPFVEVARFPVASRRITLGLMEGVNMAAVVVGPALQNVNKHFVYKYSELTSQNNGFKPHNKQVNAVRKGWVMALSR